MSLGNVLSIIQLAHASQTYIFFYQLVCHAMKLCEGSHKCAVLKLSFCQQVAVISKMFSLFHVCDVVTVSLR